MPDAAAYLRPSGRRHAGQHRASARAAAAEPGAPGPGQHQAAGRHSRRRRARGVLRPLHAGLARQGHHHGPLGDGGHPSGQAIPALSPRFPARDHGRIRAAHRAPHAGQQGRFGHRDHPGTGRGAHAHRLAHRLHVGRQRLPGGRARRGDSAVGAVQDLRDGARDSARAARSGPRDRAAVRRRARAFHAHRQPPRLRRAAAPWHAARPAGRARRPGARRGQDLRRLPGPRHPRIREDEEQRRRHGQDAGSHGDRRRAA